MVSGLFPAKRLGFGELDIYAMTSASAWAGSEFSKPSGIIERPLLARPFRSARRMVVSNPPGVRSVMLLADSLVMTPLYSWSLLVVAV